MPKATLQFDLPEERIEFKQATEAGSLASAIWDMDQWLRSKIKYEDCNELQCVRDQLYQILDDHGINIDEIL